MAEKIAEAVRSNNVEELERLLHMDLELLSSRHGTTSHTLLHIAATEGHYDVWH
jgi:hypothetical protein